MKWLVLGVVVAIAIVSVVIKILAPRGASSPDSVIDSDRSVTMPATKDDSNSARLPPALQYAPAAGAANPAPSEDSVPERRTEASAAATSAASKAARKLPGKLEAPKPAPVEWPPTVPKAEPVAVMPRGPAPRAIETPRDPWQAMNEALSRCANQDFFGRIACEQRVRLQYCGNHWGTVPQCAIGPPTDHGQ
jgi:hypothetical protein